VGSLFRSMWSTAADHPQRQPNLLQSVVFSQGASAIPTRPAPLAPTRSEQVSQPVAPYSPRRHETVVVGAPVLGGIVGCTVVGAAVLGAVVVAGGDGAATGGEVVVVVVVEVVVVDVVVVV